MHLMCEKYRDKSTGECYKRDGERIIQGSSYGIIKHKKRGRVSTSLSL